MGAPMEWYWETVAEIMGWTDSNWDRAHSAGNIEVVVEETVKWVPNGREPPTALAYV